MVTSSQGLSGKALVYSNLSTQFMGLDCWLTQDCTGLKEVIPSFLVLESSNLLLFLLRLKNYSYNLNIVKYD